MEFERGRLLHWKIAWLCALENAIDVTGDLPVLVGAVWAVGHQTAFGDVAVIRIYGGQFERGRERDDFGRGE